MIKQCHKPPMTGNGNHHSLLLCNFAMIKVWIRCGQRPSCRVGGWLTRCNSHLLDWKWPSAAILAPQSSGFYMFLRHMSGMIQKPSGALHIHHGLISQANALPKSEPRNCSTTLLASAWQQQTWSTKIGVDRVQLRDLGANLEQRGVLPSGKLT